MTSGRRSSSAKRPAHLRSTAPDTLDDLSATVVPFQPHRHERRSAHLPLALTPLIGREQDIAAVDRALGESRLVTLVGPGGVGKTSLALEAARGQQAAHVVGAWLVDLSAVADPAMVPRAVSSVLSIQERPHRPPIETLVEALHHQDMLLVLDNCEHLIDACARKTGIENRASAMAFALRQGLV
jgi:hypothetical protein